MRVVCFNCNGIRSRMHQLQAIVERHAPAVIGLQETKVVDADFPAAEVRALGYHVAWHGQKSHYGVALLTREEPVHTWQGLPGDGEEAQRRFIGAEVQTAQGPLRVFNGYFPQGENRAHATKFPGKEKFYADVTGFLHATQDPQAPLLLMGDFNVAAADIDIGIGEANRKRWLREGHCSFLPEERAWFARLMDWGLTDTYRAVHPDSNDRYSWFDYRSRGFEKEPKAGLRIDGILASRALAPRIRDAGIDYDTRAMERPSDHCPVWVDLDLG